MGSLSEGDCPLNRLRATFVAATFLLMAAAPLLVPEARVEAQASNSYLKFGMDWGSIRAQREYGAPPDYGMVWVGAWNRGSGWNSVDYALDVMKKEGVTPVIQWYYWGDDISPSCVENGCNGKSKAEWYDMARKLASTLQTKFAGIPVLVTVENEFNKGGIETTQYAPTFDRYMKEHMDLLHAVPGVQTVVGFGAWYTQAYSRFPLSIANADYLGFQTMRGSTRDTEANYRDAPEAILKTSQYLYTNFGKPTILYDLALSSYPEPEWQRIQNETLAAVFARLADYRAVGLTAIVYRGLGDSPNMDLANYFGMAERHWGLRRADASEKPSLKTWVQSVRAHREGAGLPPAPLPALVRTEASLTQTAVEIGGKLTGTLTVENKGGQAITMKWLAFAARPPGGTNAYGPYKDFGGVGNVALNPGEKKTFSFTRTFTSSDATGTWWAYAAVQYPDGHWEDQGPTTYFTVTPYVAPARVVPTVTVSPAVLYPGDNATVTVELKNTGGRPANLSSVQLLVQKLGLPEAVLAELGGMTLAPGEVRTWAFTRAMGVNDTYGDWAASLRLNHVNGTLQSSPAAGFLLDDREERVGAGTTASPNPVRQGDTLTVRVRLENLDYGRVSLAEVVLYAGPAGGTLSEVARFPALSLAKGEVRTLSATRTMTRADALGEWVTEARLVRGDGSVTVHAGAGFRVDPMPAKIVVSSSLAGTEVMQTKSLTATVTVCNVGGTGITLQRAVMAARPPGGTKAGGPYLDFGAATSVSLQPDECKSYPFTRTFSSTDAVGDWFAYGTIQYQDGRWMDQDGTHAFKVTAAPKPWSAMQEAEAFPTKTAGGRGSEAAASGGAHWNLWSNGHIQSSYNVPAGATYTLDVVAKGSVAGGVWPQMQVTVDGKVVWTGYVTSSNYLTYSLKLPLSTGSHTVRVAYLNDAVINGQDRNLLVDKVTITAPTS